ncbi:hypothetical protein BKA65DRAFT_600401 [Rhexocercosporidium sp. MPI-PUGE-AT-0058]|nr:hypothetical protein BKA65DRAFT_600401 [Rhexocercosporidium sp. MPI-PUGE-AT-0058]
MQFFHAVSFTVTIAALGAVAAPAFDPLSTRARSIAGITTAETVLDMKRAVTLDREKRSYLGEDAKVARGTLGGRKSCQKARPVGSYVGDANYVWLGFVLDHIFLVV